MSAIAANAPQIPLPPADEDLQELYKQVLAGFAEETLPDLPTPVSRSSNTERDLDVLVSAYSYGEDFAQSSDGLNRSPSFTPSMFCGLYTHLLLTFLL